MIITEHKLRKIIRNIILEASPAADRTAHNKEIFKKRGKTFIQGKDEVDRDDTKFVTDLIFERERRSPPTHWMNWHTKEGTGMINDPLNLKQEMIILSAINAVKEYCRQNKAGIRKDGLNWKEKSGYKTFDVRREEEPLRLPLTTGTKKDKKKSYEKVLEENNFYKCEIRVSGYAFEDIYRDTKLETFKEDYYRRYYRYALGKLYKEEKFDKETFSYEGKPFNYYTANVEPYNTYEQEYPNMADRSWARDHDYEFKDGRIDIAASPEEVHDKDSNKKYVLINPERDPSTLLKKKPSEQEEYIRGVYDEEYGKYDPSEDDQQMPVKGSGIPDQEPFKMPDPKASKAAIEAAKKEKEEIMAQRKIDLEDPKKYTQPPDHFETPELPSNPTTKQENQYKEELRKHHGKFAKLKGPQSRLGEDYQTSLYVVHLFVNPDCYVNGIPVGPKVAFPKIKLLTRNDMAADVPDNLHKKEIKRFKAQDPRNISAHVRAKRHAVQRKKDSARGKRIEKLNKK